MRRTLGAATLTIMLAAGLVAGLLQPAFPQAAFDLLVSPAKLELQVAAGTGQDFAIHLRNTGGESQTMKIYFNDYSIRPNNVHLRAARALLVFLRQVAAVGEDFDSGPGWPNGVD